MKVKACCCCYCCQVLQQRAHRLVSARRCPCRDLELMVKAINNANQPSCQRAAVQAVSCIAGVQSSNRRGAVKAGALQVRPASLAAARWLAWGESVGFRRGFGPRVAASARRSVYRHSPEGCLLLFISPGMPMYGWCIGSQSYLRAWHRLPLHLSQL